MVTPEEHNHYMDEYVREVQEGDTDMEYLEWLNFVSQTDQQET